MRPVKRGSEVSLRLSENMKGSLRKQPMATATVPENQIFTFDSKSTIGDLLLVAQTLTNSGQRPKLRLVASYNGHLESVAIDTEVPSPSREMAVAGCEDDPAEKLTERLTDDSVVFFEGENSRWGDMMLQDRKAYLAGGYPF